MGARIYSPLLRRFLTPDPVFAFGKPGQAINPYSYGLNDPVRYRDPDGSEACDDLSGGCPQQSFFHFSCDDFVGCAEGTWTDIKAGAEWVADAAEEVGEAIGDFFGLSDGDAKRPKAVPTVRDIQVAAGPSVSPSPGSVADPDPNDVMTMGGFTWGEWDRAYEKQAPIFDHMQDLAEGTAYFAGFGLGVGMAVEGGMGFGAAVAVNAGEEGASFGISALGSAAGNDPATNTALTIGAGVLTGKFVQPRSFSKMRSTASPRALRGQAKRLFGRFGRYPASGRGLDVHHRIPLEWRHLFSRVDPNGLSNLVGVPTSVHNEITEDWRFFKKMYSSGGRSPRQSDVIRWALEVDDRYSHRYVPLSRARAP
jgi:hypothetical protein